MKYKKISILLLLAATTAVSYAQGESPLAQLNQQDLPPVAVVPSPVASTATTKAPIKNFGVAISQNPERGKQEGLVFRGGEPVGEVAFRFLGELGVKTVISLRALHKSDKNLCAANNMECAEYDMVPVPGMDLSKSKSFMRAFKRAADEMDAGRKIFIYCQGGRHRTSAVVAALTIRDTACGKPFNRTELSSYLAKTLDEYGFHNSNGRAFFTAWEKEIRSWSEHFEDNQWLCK
ncbi:MAG TPA: hypothetical protein DCL44_06815 [Elusimicrobia bacterium]|nr:hypothetical protein [Elusimicrobiota bacterium]